MLSALYLVDILCYVHIFHHLLVLRRLYNYFLYLFLSSPPPNPSFPNPVCTTTSGITGPPDHFDDPGKCVVVPCHVVPSDFAIDIDEESQLCMAVALLKLVCRNFKDIFIFRLVLTVSDDGGVIQYEGCEEYTKANTYEITPQAQGLDSTTTSTLSPDRLVTCQLLSCILGT